MTEHDPGDQGATEPGLRQVLERATDRIEPSYAGTVLDLARQRRSRRRATLASLAAAAVVVGVVVGVTRMDGSDRLMPADVPDPAPTASAPAETHDPVLARWDPFTVVDAPVRETVLPMDVEPPATAPSVLEQPIGAAVLAWPEEGRDVRLLAVDGTWRSVPGTVEAVSGTNRLVTPALSHDGRLLAHPTDAGILVVDLAAGEQRTIAWPDPLAGPSDWPPELRWMPGEQQVAVLHWRGTWLVGLDGSSRRAPYGGEYGTGLAIDPEGPIVHRRWEDQDLRVWDGETVVSETRFLHWGDRIVTAHGLMAMSGGG
ncbi:hypothetical protein, partial [Nocardioides massiliensis]